MIIDKNGREIKVGMQAYVGQVYAGKVRGIEQGTVFTDELYFRLYPEEIAVVP